MVTGPLVQMALGRAHPNVQPTDDICGSLLGSASSGYDYPFTATGTDTKSPFNSGSIPNAVGRQVGRLYTHTTDHYEVNMVSPRWETIVPFGNPANSTGAGEQKEHLFFAWLSGKQYLDQLNDPAVSTRTPEYDATVAHHEALRFNHPPNYRIQQPTAEAWGEFATSMPFLDVHATLFVVVGYGADKTARCWAFSKPAHHSGGGIWRYGDPGSPSPNSIAFQDQANVNHPDPVLDVFVVGWGRYYNGTTIQAAVTPPMHVQGKCLPSNLSRGGKSPLPDGDFDTMSVGGLKDFFDSLEHVERAERGTHKKGG